MSHENPVIPVGAGDQVKIRTASTAEQATPSAVMDGDGLVIEVRRWDGATETYPAHEGQIMFVPDDGPGQKARIAGWRRIVHDLSQAIITGEPAPGDPLPTEEHLVMRYRVTRPIVRGVLAELAQLGLITIDDEHRATVADTPAGRRPEPGPNPAPSCQDQVRQDLNLKR